MRVFELTPDELKAIVVSAIAEAMPKYSPAPAVEIIDRAELCRRLNITEPTAIRYEKKGKIPALRAGTVVRYNYADVLRSLEAKRK
jgi:excisionase family DNA binding protein